MSLWSVTLSIKISKLKEVRMKLLLKKTLLTEQLLKNANQHQQVLHLCCSQVIGKTMIKNNYLY